MSTIITIMIVPHKNRNRMPCLLCLHAGLTKQVIAAALVQLRSDKTGEWI